MTNHGQRFVLPLVVTKVLLTASTTVPPPPCPRILTTSKSARSLQRGSPAAGVKEGAALTFRGKSSIWLAPGSPTSYVPSIVLLMLGLVLAKPEFSNSTLRSDLLSAYWILRLSRHDSRVTFREEMPLHCWLKAGSREPRKSAHTLNHAVDIVPPLFPGGLARPEAFKQQRFKAGKGSSALAPTQPFWRTHASVPSGLPPALNLRLPLN